MFKHFLYTIYNQMLFCMCYMRVPGGARGLGASVGRPQWHPICGRILAQRGHRKRAFHPCSNLQEKHWSVQKATGDESNQIKSNQTLFIRHIS